MCGQATRDFARLPRRGDRRNRLWIILAGFLSEAVGVMPAYVVISNAEQTSSGPRAGDFHVEVYGPTTLAQLSSSPAYALSEGAVAVSQARIDRLKALVVAGRPAPTLVGVAPRG